MIAKHLAVHADKGILGGAPVFTGTRVLIKNLFDYLCAGDSLERFLAHFPTVSREEALTVLALAGETLVATYEAKFNS